MWIIFAISGPVLWGLAYVINEQLYKKVSVVTSLAVTTLFFSIVMFLIAYVTKNLGSDWQAITNSKRVFILLTAETIVLIAAEVATGYSIADKNALLTALIGISYPIFIVLFGYLLFKNSQLTWSAGIGGVFIFIGIFIITYFNR